MIQRIQSLLIVLAACAMALSFMFPITSYYAESEAGYVVNASLGLIPQSNPEMLSQIEAGTDITMDQSGYIHIWPLSVLCGLVIAISVASIFIFKNRMLQVRIVAVAFLLNVVFVALVFFWAATSFDKSFFSFAQLMNCTGAHEMHYSVGTWSPVASIVLLVMAQRAIKRDEAKVRAADRLR